MTQPGLHDDDRTNGDIVAPHRPVQPVVSLVGEEEAPDAQPNNEIQQNGDESSDTDLFTSDDEVLDLAHANPSDYTKSYNRQRRQNDPTIPPSQKPKTNPQKPKGNLDARIEDQLSSLSKHASKLKMSEVTAPMTRGEKRGAEREKDKSDRATTEQVLDPRTRMLLLHMINQGVVSEIEGCISTGKEANVYHASLDTETEGKDGEPITKIEQRAIKVFKTSILVFKDREKYVTGEFRYRSGYNKSSNRAKVKVWAEKEFRNLSRLHEAGLPVPKPHKLKQHVLVMDFLGDKKGWGAPLLRDVEFEDENAVPRWEKLYRQLCGYMRIMYKKCKLVHADLSEYNVLYNDDKLWIIDVGQSVEYDHPRSLDFLRMDIKNVTSFFSRKGVRVIPEQALYSFVTLDQGSLEMSEMLDDLDKLARLAFKAETAGEDQDSEDVDLAVFRQQFMPQTMNQVPDYERDAEKVEKGESADLVYHQSLLADPESDVEAQADGDSEVSSDSDDDEDENHDPSEGRHASRRNLKRFKDTDEKRVHKQKVKEEKREQRQAKMPKKDKKAAVKGTARHRKK